MARTNKRQEIITFKADASLLEAMRAIPNRSEFIRTAILQALGSTCPLCNGTGALTPEQRAHWERFAKDHPIRHCEACDAVHLVCEVGGSDYNSSSEDEQTPEWPQSG